MDKKSLKTHFHPSDLQFAVFSSRDIIKLSATKVIAHYTYDQLGNTIPGGLYDLAMGPASQRDDPCSTCLKSFAQCPGHIGHIELCMLTYNPFFMRTVYKMLRILCLECFKIQISERTKDILKLQLRLVDAGYITEAQSLEVFKTQIDLQVHMEETSVELEEQREFDKYYEEKMKECEEVLNNNPSKEEHFNSQNVESYRMGLIDSVVKVNVKKCIFCKLAIKKVTVSYGKLVINVSKSEMMKFYEDKSEGRTPRKITSVNKTLIAEEARTFLRKAYEQDADLWKSLFPLFDKCSKNIESPVDALFMDIVPVVPPNLRPPIREADRISEHIQTNNYKEIIFANTTLKSILAVLNSKSNRTNLELTEDIMTEYESSAGETGSHKMLNAWLALQSKVDATMSAPENGKSKGLKQIIERKEGLIRQNMMGKRVNYAARTVITPDPNINVDEIGVPEIFARKLTFPTPVTSWNVKELRRFVKNGPDIHPGANYIEYENGNRVIIPTDDETKRSSLAKLLLTPNETGIKIVHRHLLNGDPLILNRQPSLHRPSMQAHKARILKGEKTFRMHYSNCKAYNADFDGDEMNAHFPQNHLARSEAFSIVNVANNFLVPKDGTPLGGLIQDHIIAGVRISMRGKFFSKEDYQQLVYQGLSHVRGKITLLPPAILKPVKLWSGKQIFSTIIINVLPNHKPKINLKSKAKINANAWEKYEKRFYTAGGTKLRGIEMTEAEVVIRNGELLVGVLDKMHYGSTPYSLVHCIYEIYGGNVSTQLLSSFTRCFTLYLQWTGFTLGVRDILVLSNADKKRKEIIEESRQIGFRTTAKALEIPEDSSLEKLAESLEAAYSTNFNFRTVLDRTYKSVLDSYTNEINQTCLPAGLLEKFPDNNLQLMVQSGAKGSTVNTMQISCLLGQIELEGKRPPLMISGKSLPSFAIFETSPKSGGFIDGRFMTGIQPQDFFFHCMAGREGLIDTAVKTSRSGYLQRCLIKHLEGLNVNYDLTVRDSDNSVIQFLYGEDGMDITQAQFLKSFQMDFLYSNTKAIVDEKTLEKLQNSDVVNKQLHQYVKKLHSWVKKHKDHSKLAHHSPFQQFSKELRDEIQVKKPNKIVKATGRRKIDEKLMKLWRKTDDEKRETYCKQNRKCPDPLISKFRPDNAFGSVSENMLHLINDYIKKNPTADRHEIENVMYAKNVMSLACPGEPVGLLAAQSIGEPSTQMTLNTFHFAGRGEMNVTLGIPRLREILMMASKNIKTPSMDIPFLPISNLENVAEKLRLRLIRVTLADVLEKIDVKSCLKLRPYRARQYNLRFQFLPYDGYDKKFCVKPKFVLRYMTNNFFKLMFRAIIKAAKSKSSLVDLDDDKPKRTSKQRQTLEDFEDSKIDAKEPEREEKQNDESSEDEENADDGDATEDRRKQKQTDECDYEEPEGNEVDDAYGSENENYAEELGTKGLDETEISDEAARSVVDNHELAETYTYDKIKHSWCEITFNLPAKNRTVDLAVLLKEVAKKAVIWETPNIKRAITYSNKEKLTLKTEGINIIEMFNYSKILDINRLYTNDIHAVSQTYGIEAARQVIVKEVENVFNVYGIRVDPRHLFLIADYMTFSGVYKPLNRSGMTSSASPLQQMSFETSLQFLTSATVQGKKDSLESPSSRLIVGQPCRSGTGAFSLITEYNILQKYLGK